MKIDAYNCSVSRLGYASRLKRSTHPQAKHPRPSIYTYTHTHTHGEGLWSWSRMQGTRLVGGEGGGGTAGRWFI